MLTSNNVKKECEIKKKEDGLSFTQLKPLQFAYLFSFHFDYLNL